MAILYSFFHCLYVAGKLCILPNSKWTTDWVATKRKIMMKTIEAKISVSIQISLSDKSKENHEKSIFSYMKIELRKVYLW